MSRRRGQISRRVSAIVLAGIAAIAMALSSGHDSHAGDGVRTPVIPKSPRHPLKTIWSGKRYASETARALHNDRKENPANGVLADGDLLWRRTAGPQEKSCESCHRNPAFSMRSAGTRFPRYYKPWKKPMSLEQRINRCRTAFMSAEPWPEGSKSLIAMTTLVRHQSRRTPVRPKVDGRATPFFKRGERIYRERIGQANMSCANCHETYQGKRLGAQTISQGQSNGFPAYNLSTARVSSLHQQFQRCNLRIGAEPLALGSDDYVNLELYLAWRGQGLPVETPAVRD